MKHLSLEQIFEYIDGVSNPAESRRIAIHLRECSVCNTEVEQHRSITATLDKSTTIEPSSKFSSQLMTAVMDEPLPRKVQSTTSVLRYIKPSWLVAASVIISIGILIAAIPQKRVHAAKPLGVEHVVQSYSEGMMKIMSSVAAFFTTISSYIPIKSTGTLLMIICAVLLLWAIDTAAKKRFLRI